MCCKFHLYSCKVCHVAYQKASNIILIYKNYVGIFYFEGKGHFVTFKGHSYIRRSFVTACVVYFTVLMQSGSCDLLMDRSELIKF